MLNERTYPLNSWMTGTYTEEPIYGKLIRDAMGIGFTLFAFNESGRDREIKQANAILEVVNKKKGGVIILSGYDHILEAPFGNDKPWMAQLLKESGVDPLTINQDILTEDKSSEETPYYKLYDLDYSAVFVRADGKIFNGPPDLNVFDILLYHPRSNSYLGRPEWARGATEQYYVIEKDSVRISCPCLIKAYDTNEMSSAVPLDIVEVPSLDDDKALILPGGKFKIELSNKRGQKDSFQIVIP